MPINVKANVPQFDTLVHVGMYLAFAWLLTQAVRIGSRLPAAPDGSDEGAAQAGMPETDYYFWAWMYATGYGLLIEVLQMFLPWRSASVTDALANAAGAALGVWIGRAWPAHPPTEA